MAISMLKIRRPLGRLIFNMGIAIPGKTVFLIETAPRLWLCTCLLLLTLMLWHRQVIFKSKGDKLSSSAKCRFWTRVFGICMLDLQQHIGIVFVEWIVFLKIKSLRFNLSGIISCLGVLVPSHSRGGYQLIQHSQRCHEGNNGHFHEFS